MKVTVEAESQAELDAKRPELLRTLAGQRFDCVVKAKGSSIYSQEKLALAPRKAAIKAQDEIADFWSKRWDAHMTALKDEIDAIFRG